jgi:hypothetical protein
VLSFSITLNEFCDLNTLVELRNIKKYIVNLNIFLSTFILKFEFIIEIFNDKMPPNGWPATAATMQLPSRNIALALLRLTARYVAFKHCMIY